jgi:hypothetical protein
MPAKIDVEIDGGLDGGGVVGTPHRIPSKGFTRLAGSSHNNQKSKFLCCQSLRTTNYVTEYSTVLVQSERNISHLLGTC